MLKVILAVTITAPDLAAVEQAYSKHLSYKVVERGKLSSELASVWNAPQMAGRACLLLQPESGAEVFLRFVQAEPIADYAPLKTYGWNATELLVQDPDELAAKLADSPFKIIGPPRNLASNDAIRAMQVLGPANELLYLTRIAPGSTAFNLSSAQSYVDRVFIIVVGGKEMEPLRQYYAAQMKLPVTPALLTRISVLSNAYQLAPETPHKLAVAQLPKDYLLELDQYPAAAAPRPQRKGELPPGAAVVSLTIESLDNLALQWLKAPTVLAEKPYNGRRVAVTAGAAGELIELVETK